MVTPGGLPLLRLAPEQAGAARLLARFAARHQGVTVVPPDYRDDGPWRAEIAEGDVPGRDASTSAVLTARQPAELLGKLQKLFNGSG